MTDPRRALGMGTGPGHAPFTKLGNSLRGNYHANESLNRDAQRVYSGWLSDIRLPIGDVDDAEERLPGVMVKILFDSKNLNRFHGNHWFRLAHSPVEMLQQYGTADSIRQSRIRLELAVTGSDVRTGKAKVTGDKRYSLTHRNYNKTQVACWGDVIQVSGGKRP